MIRVFQTRTSLSSFGNCFEACLASILEVPLAAVPDRADFVDLDAWQAKLAGERAAGRDPLDLEQPESLDDWSRELDRWLRDRGLDLLRAGVAGTYAERDADVTGPAEIVMQVAGNFGGYWIGEWTTAGAGHAVVMLGRDVVHNPMRGVLGAEGLLELRLAWIPLLANVRAFDRFRESLLPDVAGETAQARAELWKRAG